MDKPTGDQPTPQTQESTVEEPAKLANIAAEAAPTEAANSEAVKSEAVKSEAANSEAVTVAALPQPEPVVVSAPAATPEPAPIVATVETPKLEVSNLDALKLDSTIAAPAPPVDVRPADVPTDETIAAAAAPSLLSGWTAPLSLARVRHLAPLAATIAIALALGALAGSLATAGLGGASEPVAQSADAQGMKEQLARLHGEIAALKTSIDGSAKSASAQLIKLGDRLDRFEKTQAEPTAKLAKLAEVVDRIERRAPATSLAAAAARDITGSVTALAPAPQLDAPETRPASPPVLEGWRVRSVFNGAALIQARAGGVMEVEPGDNLPGLGRIEAIRRQEGKWVVVTSKGLILTR